MVGVKKDDMPPVGFKCRFGEAEKGGGGIKLRSESDARGGVRIRCGIFLILLVLSYCGLVLVQRNRGFGGLCGCGKILSDYAMWD